MLRTRTAYVVTSQHKYSENDLHARVHKIYFKYFTYFYSYIIMTVNLKPIERFIYFFYSIT